MKERYFTISESEAREISRGLFSTFKYFSSLISGLECPSPVWDSRHEIASADEPHKFYYFCVKEKKVYIHLHRDHTYSLEIYGYQPLKIKPRSVGRGLYRKYFGIYRTLEEAVSDFFRVVDELCRIYNSELF